MPSWRQLAIAQQLAAAESNLKRVRGRREGVAYLYKHGMHGGEANHVAAADYYLAEAERKVAELEASPPISLKPVVDTPHLTRLNALQDNVTQFACRYDELNNEWSEVSHRMFDVDSGSDARKKLDAEYDRLHTETKKTAVAL